MAVLQVDSFGGGVALAGSADAKRTDELLEADGYDIGARGQLVAASDLATTGLTTIATLTRIFGMIPFPSSSGTWIVAAGTDGAGNALLRAITSAGANVDITGSTVAVTTTYGFIVTAAMFADGAGLTTTFVCFGARSFRFPRTAPGIYAAQFGGLWFAFNLSTWDALGTGPQSSDVAAAGLPGTQAKQLYPRGIFAYNGHLFAWGFDDSDATNGEGANRVMFSNLPSLRPDGSRTGGPRFWGLDPAVADPSLLGTDRAYADSDAILVGGAGSVIRAGYVWAGKAWLGSSDGLHYIEGFGRDSFISNGAIPVSRSKSVIGPTAMIEGPDRMLYGVADDTGLWRFDGADSDPVGARLRSYDTKSNGWWDLIWTDLTRADGYPGRTNQDLVWMLSDPIDNQVWVVIPFCNASAGYGFGGDTVAIKYHVLTGGFTRQVFAGVILTAGCVLRREADAAAGIYVAQPGATTNIARYGYKATPAASPAVAATAPAVTLGEYAPSGPDGVGVVRKPYLTLSWDSGALPLAFTVTPTLDGRALGAVKLTITAAGSPGTPADGDLWVDTSGTDTNLGNGTAGAFIPASASDYLLFRWVATWAKWVPVPGMGQRGTRITVPIAHATAKGTRIKYRVLATSYAGRWQFEGLGFSPNTLRADR